MPELVAVNRGWLGFGIDDGAIRAGKVAGKVRRDVERESVEIRETIIRRQSGERERNYGVGVCHIRSTVLSLAS